MTTFGSFCINYNSLSDKATTSTDDNFNSLRPKIQSNLLLATFNVCQELDYKILLKLRMKRIFFVPGEIRTVLALDREEADLYHLEVEAVDGGVPRLTSTAMLEVRVLDENDNAPEVIQPLQEVITVREKQPPGELRPERSNYWRDYVMNGLRRDTLTCDEGTFYNGSLIVTGTPVAQIIATDADKDENATLVYDFKKGKS